MASPPVPPSHRKRAQANVAFEGPIRASADDRWLLIDAICEVGRSGHQWIVRSTPTPALSSLPGSTLTYTDPRPVEATDLTSGWTGRADSPARLATLIRTTFGSD